MPNSWHLGIELFLPFSWKNPDKKGIGCLIYDIWVSILFWHLHGKIQKNDMGCLICDIWVSSFFCFDISLLWSMMASLLAMWGAWMVCWKCQRHCKIDLIRAHGFSMRSDGRCCCWPSFQDNQNCAICFCGSSCALVILLMSLRLLFHSLFFNEAPW